LARKKPFSPRASIDDRRALRTLANRWQYLQDRLGGQRALADALKNPQTGKPYDPRTLRKWWSGERKLPGNVTEQITALYKSVKKEEERQRRRTKRRKNVEKVKEQIRVLPFTGWWLGIENEVYNDYETDTVETTLENILSEMLKTEPDSVLILGEGMPGWLSPEFGKHTISELCRSDLILFGFRVFVNDSYTRIYPVQHRPPLPMWNYERKMYRRKEDYPKLLQLIEEAWQNLAGGEFGFPVLVGFTRDPEQIE